ncbi:MAG: TSUP family transporter, partial [Mariprofundaceae bacterium]
VFKQLIPGLMMGASLGLWLTLQVPAVVVLVGLALLDAWIAFDYGREIKQRSSSLPLTACSGPIGYISGSLGIGGGTMLVPLLRRLLSLRNAVGTSAMCGMVMAGVAVVMNVALESEWFILLSDHGLLLSGFFVGLILILPRASAWSAHLHVQLSEKKVQRWLKALFAVLSIYLFCMAVYSA